MKKLIIILVLTAIISVDAQKRPKKKENPEFLKWRNQYKKDKWADKTSESIERRAERVLIKKQRCAEHNANPDKTFEMGSNEFDHLTSDEFKSRLTGLKPPVEVRALPRPPVFNSFMTANMPYSVDWTQYCPPIYSQGSCGSCWAFASLATLECWRKMKNFTSISFSPQYLIDCDTGSGNNQCNGGWPTTAYNNLYNKLGGSAAAWADYPYTSFSFNATYTGYSACKSTTRYPLGYTTPYQVNVNGNEEIMKYLLANFGPVTIAMWASSPYMSYKSGIFYDPLCPAKTATVPQCDFRNVNHAMVITGYNTINGTNVWKVRNSWGTSWGMSGYSYVVRNATNNCNFACYAMFVDV